MTTPEEPRDTTETDEQQRSARRDRIREVGFSAVLVAAALQIVVAVMLLSVPIGLMVSGICTAAIGWLVFGDVT